VLRPPSAAALERLTRAADASDRELDRALSDVGVLPPLDLDQIRHVLTRRGMELAVTRNADGHAIIQIAWNAQLSALIHHDGRVQLLSSAAA
jgi:hypothetical protein